MSHTTTVSIIVPVYNVEQYIEQCAISLFEQTYSKNIEYIFIDDASTDNSIKTLRNIANKYQNLNINISSNDKNIGPAGVRNLAFKKANGDYIIACDSDDWLEFNAIELLVTSANKHNADIVAAPFYTYNKNKQTIVSFPYGDTLALNSIPCDTLHFSLCNKLIRRSIITNNNLQAFEGRNYWEDLYISFRAIILSKQIVTIKQPIYHYRTNNNASLTKKNHKKVLADRLFYANEIIRWLETNNLTQQYAPFLNNIKFAAKIKMIRGEYIELDRWKTTFPESNVNIIKNHKTISLPYRIALQTINILPNRVTKILCKLLGKKCI